MNLTRGEVPSEAKTKPSGFKAFLARLRKRQIIQTLAAFIGGGWLVYEIVHWVLVVHYHLPERLLDITIITLIGTLLAP